LTDEQGTLVASTLQRGEFGIPLGEGALVGIALSEGRPTEGLWIEVDPEGGDVLFQAVCVPILRPGASRALVGTIVAAREIDTTLVRGLKEQTNSDVVFFSLDTLGVPRPVTGTMTQPPVVEALAAVRLEEESGTDTALIHVELNGEDFVGTVGALTSAAGFPLGGFVGLRSRSAELQGFVTLRRTIYLAFAVGLVLAMLSSAVVARQVTRPIRLLVAATRDVREGKYSGAIAARSRDEIGDLARAFDDMRRELKEKQNLVEYLERAGEKTVSVFTDDRAAPAPSDEVTEPAAIRVRSHPALAPTAAFQLGTVVSGRYEIKKLLGEGGMGMVYRAWDRELGETVALKTLRPEAVRADANTLERFKQEIRLARRITHRNVVRTHDLGEVDGMYYITMEYVAGANLKELIRKRGSLPVGVTLTIGRQLCRALEVAHEERVIHRDIKPHNIAVEPSGFIKVMDFGIARLAQQQQLGKGLTAAGTAIGTPEYMAPEQLMGEEISERVDIYAAGAVLFECLTGRTVFEAPTVTALLAKHLEQAPPDPRALVPEIPDALSTVILRALAKKPADRWPTAVALAEALDRITVVST
jgi:serine/threonine-protein kinase